MAKDMNYMNWKNHLILIFNYNLRNLDHYNKRLQFIYVDYMNKNN